MPSPISSTRRLIFSLITTVLVITVPLGVVEATLRVIYRDGGRTTLGAPGGQEFEHQLIDRATERRTPPPSNPKSNGAERIVVFGDSITWGYGIHRWRDTYPNQLLTRLNATGRPFDIEVFANTGRNIDGHARAAKSKMAALDADFAIYQWFHNDLELHDRAPRWRYFWRTWPASSWLTKHSDLYFVLDKQLSQQAVAYGWGADRSYTQYVLDEYGPGTAGWTLFEDQFHRWATYSTVHAKHALVFLYPVVPFRGSYPLEDLNARMRALAQPHRLVYPAFWLRNQVGHNVPDPAGAGGVVRQSDGTEGILVSGPSIPLSRGHYEVTERLRLDQAANGSVAHLEITAGERVIAERTVMAPECGQPGEWQTVTLELNLDDPLTPDVEWHVTVPRGVHLSVDSVSLPISYEHLDVVDLKDRLNAFDTHASVFDSHPNERAHAEIAKALSEWVLSK